jgi:RNA polymerase-binding transcription factor DksA
MGNIRNSIVSLQTWYKKVEQCRTSLLTRRLNLLKCDYLTNQNENFQLESTLTEWREDELRLKINNMKIFEHLHNERLSPRFLNLIRRKIETSLSGICDDNGIPFSTDEERNEHIVSSYEKIYLTKAGEDQINYENCINHFLGPKIVNSRARFSPMRNGGCWTHHCRWRSWTSPWTMPT